MDAIAYLREDMRITHEWQEQTIEGATQEQLDWHPPGKANPLGATYAHSLCSEDGIVNMLLLAGQPLYEGEWKDRTGISDPRWSSEFDWARDVKVDLEAALEYAEAVYRSTDDYLASLEPADLDRVLDLTEMGMGEKSVAWLLSSWLSSHTSNMTGEISTLKGLQGAQGYPG
jgi:hypothetical protein